MTPFVPNDADDGSANGSGTTSWTFKFGPQFQPTWFCDASSTWRVQLNSSFIFSLQLLFSYHLNFENVWRRWLKWLAAYRVRSWCLFVCSSDLGPLQTLMPIFRELLKTLGVPLIVDDLYSLDSESLASLQPLHALIFLFKWVSTSSDSMSGNYDPEFPGFFAHQVVNNACATLAVLNALGNIPALKSGSQLTQLLEFTNGMDPQTRGLVITSSDWLREAHNSLSPPSAISLDGLGLPKQTEDAYHFVVYLPFMGSLYELDGLKPHAVRHGSYNETGEGWLSRARSVVSRFPRWWEFQ